MIINIRGTSGSGKSTLIRRIMDCYETKMAVRRSDEPKRKQPHGYILSRPKGRDCVIVGHYETPCGGCDTINGMDRIYQLVREGAEAGYDVIFEGLLISAEFNRTYALHTDDLDLFVVGLDIPLEKCVDSVNERRWAKNPAKPGVNPKNTESKWKGTRSTMKKLAEHGVDAQWADRDGAFNLIAERLNLEECE